MSKKPISFGKIVFAVLTVIASVNSAVACDKQAARNVQEMIKAMANISQESGVVKVRWGGDFKSWGKDNQLKMARAYADSDACLSGSPREIRFYSPTGKFNAVATPTAGIRLVD